jgi:hypothetical protein
MKKSLFVLIVIIIVGISLLADVAVRLSEDPQWTPFVQSWNRKLYDGNTSENEIPVCASPRNTASNK